MFVIMLDKINIFTSIYMIMEFKGREDKYEIQENREKHIFQILSFIEKLLTNLSLKKIEKIYKI